MHSWVSGQKIALESRYIWKFTIHICKIFNCKFRTVDWNTQIYLRKSSNFQLKFENKPQRAPFTKPTPHLNNYNMVIHISNWFSAIYISISKISSTTVKQNAGSLIFYFSFSPYLTECLTIIRFVNDCQSINFTQN